MLAEVGMQDTVDEAGVVEEDEFGTELVLRKPSLRAFGQTTRLLLATRQARNAPQTSGAASPPSSQHIPHRQ